MKQIKKITIFILILSLSIFSMSSCSEDAKHNSDFFTLQENYEVGIKIGEFETSGRLTIHENSIHFLHTSENTVLFGMEEVFEKDHYTVNYHDIQWDNNELFPKTYIIYEIFEIIKKCDMQNKKTTSMKEQETYEYDFSVDDTSFSLYIQKGTEKPLKISGFQKDLSFEINFLL